MGKMDFTKCFEILNNRAKEQHDSSCPCCTQAPTTPVQGSINSPPTTSQQEHQQVLISHHETDWEQMKSSLITEVSAIQNLTPVELIHQIVLIQQYRVKLYQLYNQELQTILIHNKLDLYPPLCTKITGYFAQLSLWMLTYKTAAESNKLQNLMNTISNIQKAEKDKLLYVAAFHLDQIQPSIPTMHSAIGGSSEVQKQYLRKKIQETESAISEEMENIQAIKVDFMENV